MIGPKNQEYYLNQFARFDANGKAGATWHWPACFMTFYWLLYRKMWLNALIYFVLPYILGFSIGLVAGFFGNSSGAMSVAYVLSAIVFFILPPMYANALYYQHCKKRIAEVIASSSDTQRQLGALSAKGGTSGVILIFVLVFIVIAVIGILAAIAIPQYQEYVTRANTTQAMVTGKRAADLVTNFYNHNKALPDTLAVAGFSEPLPTAISGISVSQDGTIIITMSGGPLAGKTILLVPSLDANKQVVWACMSKDILDRQLPQQCRKSK